MYRYSSFESRSGGISHVPRRLCYRGCVSSNGSLWKNGDDRVASDGCRTVWRSLHLPFCSLLRTNTHTHTRHPREFRRKLLPGRPVVEFLRRWKSLSRATQQRTLPLGDSALSLGFDDAYPFRCFAERMLETRWVERARHWYNLFL